MTVGRRIGQFLLVCLLPGVVALWSVGVAYQGGVGWPWRPWTQDLAVYREAAIYLLQGRDFYRLENMFPYIYPPIAAVLAIPLALIPWGAAQVVWTLLNVAVVVAILRHLGVRRPWQLSFAAIAALVFLSPLTGTLGLGQLGIILLGLVLLDATPGPHLFRGTKRLLPAGVLTGFAAGLKLTPAVFIVHYFLTKRYRQGFVALGTFAATVVIGMVASPAYAPGYWRRLAGGDSGANPDAYGWINNISVMSAVYRFTDVTTIGTVVGLGLSGLLVLAGLAAAWVSHRAGRELLGISILGMVSCVANPIAWVHHLTWVLPLLVAGVRDRLPPVLRWSVLIGVLWCVTNPQFGLRGAPWAQAEIHEYNVAEKVFAAGPDIVVTLMVLLALVTLRAAPKSGEALEAGPRRALRDGENQG